MKPTQQFYSEYRCHSCHKLLFKGMLIDSEVEVKCKRCNELNTFQGESANKYICFKEHCTRRVGVGHPMAGDPSGN